jgi:hypothetical protein
MSFWRRGGTFLTLIEYLQDILELEEAEMFMVDPAFTLNLEDFEKEQK